MTEEQLSRTALKRKAQQVESVAQELADLSPSEINGLPCQDDLKQEIILAGTLKGGARKRQIKFVSKELRKLPIDPFLDFLERRKGSRLKKNVTFHELERLRDAIIQEAIDRMAEIEDTDAPVDQRWLSPTVVVAGERFAGGNLDLQMLQDSALRFARSRKPAYKKELFRALQAAQERSEFHAATEGK